MCQLVSEVLEFLYYLSFILWETASLDHDFQEDSHISTSVKVESFNKVLILVFQEQESQIMSTCQSLIVLLWAV